MSDRYTLQSKCLDGRFNDVASEIITDGSHCKYKEIDGTEVRFPGGGWPSGGVDTHKNLQKGDWMNECLPCSWRAVTDKISSRNVGDIIMFEGKDSEVVYNIDRTFAYRIIKTKTKQL
jgi:hypothetical protein